MTIYTDRIEQDMNTLSAPQLFNRLEEVKRLDPNALPNLDVEELYYSSDSSDQIYSLAEIILSTYYELKEKKEGKKDMTRTHITRKLEVEYNALTDTYVYSVIDLVDVEKQDDRGTYGELVTEIADKIVMTGEDLRRDYKNIVPLANHQACMNEIRSLYNIQ